jgi:hypothetical protein
MHSRRKRPGDEKKAASLPGGSVVPDAADVGQCIPSYQVAKCSQQLELQIPKSRVSHAVILSRLCTICRMVTLAIVQSK